VGGFTLGQTEGGGTQIMADKYLLRVTAGPSYDASTHRLVRVNEAEPFEVSGPWGEAQINVRIRNYRGTFLWKCGSQLPNFLFFFEATCPFFLVGFFRTYMFILRYFCLLFLILSLSFLPFLFLLCSA
jgi:hypothetical protein